MGRESKCVAEALDLFSQVRLQAAPPLLFSWWRNQYNTNACGVDEELPVGLEDDIEDQIKREMEGLKPKSTSSFFSAVQLDTPCCSYRNLILNI